ncbi:MAG: hypothetical protein J0M33_12655 [Anaerolineae bacterium]|nr:hypothetical protein [Anaerolineae bacterium]
MFKRLSTTEQQLLWKWGPTLLASMLATLIFIVIGQTPVIRALALGGAIAGVTAALRPFGGWLALVGGLALALTPAFWSQTGGSQPDVLILSLLIVGLLVMLLVGRLGRQLDLAMGAGLLIFIVLFWLLVGTPRSLRLTVLLSAWMLFLLVDSLLTAHPRAEDPSAKPLKPYQQFGLLLLAALGVVNDPLFTLLIPAVAITLLASHTPIPRLYWIAFIVIGAIGGRGLWATYLDSGWWDYPALNAISAQLQVPFVIREAWREPLRWIDLGAVIIKQFTLPGLLLGILGVSRLSRWYPPIGTLTLFAFVSYATFGLAYFGADRPVLLLPMWMIQIFWMTYAMHAISHWLQRSFTGLQPLIRLATPAGFALLPAFLLLQLTNRP